MAGEQLYRRTEAGKTAWQRQDASIPVEYRRVLGMIEDDVHPDTLRALARYAEADLLHLLQELVGHGFLEAVAAGEHHDLDFTSRLPKKAA